MTGNHAGVLQRLSDLGPSWQSYFAAHQEWLVVAVFTAFTVVNSIRIFAYVPQILKAARDQNGASAISCGTWSMFLMSHLTTIAYSIVCLGDLVMAVIFMGNAFACLVIVVLTLLTRRRHRRQLSLGITVE